MQLNGETVFTINDAEASGTMHLDPTSQYSKI